jgi:hypothetical protein
MNLRLASVVVFASAAVFGGCSSDGGDQDPGHVHQPAGSDSGTATGGAGGAAQADTCAADDNYTPFHVNMTGSKDGLTVTINSDPPVPTLGDHSTWNLKIMDPNGPIAPGTKVSVTCSMTHSGFSHGCPATIKVKELGNGVYEASPVIFNMQGHWHIDFGIGSAYVPIELCVE